MKNFECGDDAMEIRIEQSLGFQQKKEILNAARSGSPGCAGRVRKILQDNRAILVAYLGRQPVAVQALSHKPPGSAFEPQNMILFVTPIRRRFLRIQLGLALSLLHVSVSESARAMPPLAVSLTREESEMPVEGAEEVPACAESIPECDRRQVDRLFPGTGHVGVTVSSGIPHAILGEVNVGASPWFSIAAGATVSAKFNETSVFLRPRVAIVQGSWFDVAAHFPLVYYPAAEVRHDYDWVLTNPALFFRVHAGRRTSLYLGAGLVFASTTESIASAFRDPEPIEPPEDWDFSSAGEVATKTTVNGVWNTFHGGVDFKLGGGWITQLDLILLMDGMRISTNYADKIGPPVFAQAGVTYVF